MNISSYSELPDVIKNILIINCLLFLATVTLESQGINLTRILGLHQFQSPDFRPHQLITHMFMHGSLFHLLVNMFAIWMFSKVLENVWGGKRFLKFYIITGLGAALIYIGYIQIQINTFSIKFSQITGLFLSFQHPYEYLQLEVTGALYCAPIWGPRRPRGLPRWGPAKETLRF